MLQTSSGLRLLRLRNPHGGTEWNGAFADDDTENWTPALRAEVETQTHHHLVSDDDGSFFMELRDFARHISKVGMCRPFMETEGHPHGFKCNSATGAWVAGETAGGKHGRDTFKHNPTFSFVASDPSVTISLYQLDQRGHAVPLPWIDMYLFLLAPADTAALEDDDTAQLKKIEPLFALSSRLKSKDVPVKPGTRYTLVAAAHTPGVEGHFCLTIASRTGVRLARTEGSAPSSAERRAMARVPCARAASCYVCHHGFEPQASFFEFPEGRVHADGSCKQRYYEATSEKCLVCRKGVLPGTRHYSVDGGKVHTGECHEQWRRDTADKCLMCSGPILGSFYEMDDGKVCGDGDCLVRYREAAAPKCLMCSAPILASYFEVDSLDGSGKGKVCAEGDCLQRFKRSA